MTLRQVTLAVSLATLAVGYAATPVYFSLIVSYGEFGFDSSGGIASVDIALDYINRTQLLPGYDLQYKSVRNSKVQVLHQCIAPEPMYQNMDILP